VARALNIKQLCGLDVLTTKMHAEHNNPIALFAASQGLQ